MIEILPDRLSKHIEAKCGSLATTPDFFDVIGQVSWFEDGVAPPKEEAPAPAPAPEPKAEEPAAEAPAEE